MKTIFLNLIMAGAISLLVSCGGGTENKAPATDTSSSGGSLMQGNTYDPNKIDPVAPVVNVTLHAQGNSMTEMHFDQSLITVPAKSTVKLTLINDAKDTSMEHNFVLIDDGTAEKVANEGLKAGAAANYTPRLGSVYVGTKVTMPGETTTITFPSPAKGNYQFICTYPGHWQKMQGKFIVD